MDEKEKEITYKEDPAGFVKKCYGEWDAWFEQFKPRFKENVQLANNYSQVLADRKNQKIKKASFFFPLISPAIYARTAYQKQMVFQIPEPIKVKSEGDTSEQIALNVQTMVHHFIKEDKLKDRLWLEMKIMQEQIPIGFLKVSEFTEEEIGLKVEENISTEVVLSAEVPLGKEKKFEVVSKTWRPHLDLLLQHQVFYDPSPSQWESKSFIGTITGLTTAEVMERKRNSRFTKPFTLLNLKEKGEHMEAYDFLDEIYLSMGQETKSQGVTSNLWKVKELFHIVQEEDAEGNATFKTKITTVCGEVVLRDDDFPYQKLKFSDLFIPVIGYPVLGRCEGLTTTDMMKYIQHVVSDVFNITLDVARYGLHPPRLRRSDCKILNERIIDAGVEWEVDMSAMPDGTPIRDISMQMFDVTPTDKDFFALLNVLLERSEIISSSPSDILMGAPTDPNEKLGQTERRWQAVNARLQGIGLLNDAFILKKIAYAFWCMTLEVITPTAGSNVKINQNIEFTLDQINGRFDFSVPHLEGLSQREADSQKLEKLLLTLNTMPFVKDPTVAPVVAPIMWKIFYKLCELQMIPDLDKLLPKEMPIGMPPPGAGGGRLGGMPPEISQLLALTQGQK